MNKDFHNKFLDILIYIGTHIDKNILIRCASISDSDSDSKQDTHTDFQEIHGDLFTTSDKTSSLAHCVAKDLRMGKGIATFFKKKYAAY